MDRVERLTNLLALLKETREPLTLVQIAGSLEGQYPDGEQNRRAAFERDKAALRDIGVPIETEQILGGPEAGSTRYWIDRDRYELRDLDLDPDETRALQVALAATRPGSQAGQDALWKVGAGLLGGSAAVSAVVPDDPALPIVREAVTARHAVRFRYRGLDRTVDPWGLLLRSGLWYLIGYDHARGEQRTYRLDRRESDVAVLDGTTFERPAGFDPAKVLFADPLQIGGEPDAAVRTARVRVDAGPAATVVADLGDDRVLARHPDGSVEVSVPYVNTDAFRTWVLGLLEHAEVLEPADLRADIVAWLVGVAGAAGGAR
ncbi:MAG TPA: WYL domain-containing protein [Ilumatobacter sp.]|nr:WYL domain-containing protein [Ilumatobacter sp.]